MPGPVLYTPLTKITDHWLTAQWTSCGDMELDYYRCASRVGAVKAQTACKIEQEDFRECVTKAKQIRRYIVLQAERRKQKKGYLDPPPKDSFGTC